MMKSKLFSEKGIYINYALVTCFYTDLSPINFPPAKKMRYQKFKNSLMTNVDYIK